MPKRLTVTTRLNELEFLQLDALAFGLTKSDVLREALSELWDMRGARALQALDIVSPGAADRLRALMDAGHEANAGNGEE